MQAKNLKQSLPKEPKRKLSKEHRSWPKKKRRRTEAVTGLIIILVAFSYVTSLLLDFNFLSPDTTLQEDLAYLSEHIHNQEISSWSWLATSMITLVAIPFYLVIFRKRLRSL
ncbi:MAG: hypothetical protein KAT15_11980, partial [Bacteroidales bacterium]|nr:hypothetical protein [Bacteroidales bacterium]